MILLYSNYSITWTTVIESYFSQANSRTAFKLKFHGAPCTPSSGFQICKGFCNPNFMLTQRFWVTDRKEIRALQWSEFSIHQTLTLYERQLCSQRTWQRGEKRQYLANYLQENCDSDRKQGKYLRSKHSVKSLERSYSIKISYRISSYISTDFTSL